MARRRADRAAPGRLVIAGGDLGRHAQAKAQAGLAVWPGLGAAVAVMREALPHQIGRGVARQAAVADQPDQRPCGVGPAREAEDMDRIPRLVSPGEVQVGRGDLGVETEAHRPARQLLVEPLEPAAPLRHPYPLKIERPLRHAVPAGGRHHHRHAPHVGRPGLVNPVPCAIAEDRNPLHRKNLAAPFVGPDPSPDAPSVLSLLASGNLRFGKPQGMVCSPPQGVFFAYRVLRHDAPARRTPVTLGFGQF